MAVPEEPALTVTFAGSGDAFGSGGRSQACIHLRGPDGSGPVLLDCGAASLSALKRLGLDPGEIAAVFVSTSTATTSGACASSFFTASSPAAPNRSSSPARARRLADAMESMFPGSSTTPRHPAGETIVCLLELAFC